MRSNKLTKRQEEIRLLMLRGIVNAEDLAVAMGISIPTVKMQLGKMFVKYDVRSSLELLVKVLRGASEEELKGFLG